MFLQAGSWRHHINYVYPPTPVLGRLVTFLPMTQARTIVVCALPMPPAWWSYAIAPGADGVVAFTEKDGFRITALDFVRANEPIPFPCPCPLHTD